jgi:hypothetical protein
MPSNKKALILNGKIYKSMKVSTTLKKFHKAKKSNNLYNLVT